MVSVSDDLKLALKQDGVVERDYIIIDDTQIYLWFDLYDDCYKDGNIVQNFIMKRIEFEYANSYDFKEKEFKAYKEFQLPDESWESISFGTFIVTEVTESDTKETVKIVAYDYALKFATDYVTILDYDSDTVTMLDVLEEACDNVGVTLATTSFANDDFIVDSNQFDGAPTHGNVVSAVAGMAGCFAKIRGDDQLYLIFTNDTSVTIYPAEYSEFQDKRDTHPITIISLGVSNVEGENIEQRDEAGIALYGENYLNINDNPFAYTQAKRTALITDIYTNCIGFSYSSMVLKNCLYPYLECGDKVTVINKDGDSIDTIILRRTFSGTECTLEAPSIIDATVEYSNPLSTLDVTKLTEIRVDKQEQTITSLATITQEITTDLNNNYVTTETLTNEINQTLTETSDMISATGGFNLLKNTQFYLDGEDWTISGGATYDVLQTTDVEQNTLCKSELMLNAGTFTQYFQCELGKTYTISGKYTHENTNQSYIRIYNNPTVYETVLNTTEAVTTRTEFSYSYTATVNNPYIVLYSNTSDFYISDLIIQNGESKVWSPNAQEIRGYNYVLNADGQRIYNVSDTTLYSQSDANSFDTYEGETVLSTYGETFEAESGVCRSSLTVNDLGITYITGNIYFIG